MQCLRLLLANLWNAGTNRRDFGRVTVFLRKRVFDPVEYGQNGINRLVSLTEYFRLKGMRKSPISRIGLRNMVIKFEETGYLGVVPGRGREPDASGNVKEGTVAVAERASDSIYSSASGRSVSRELEISWLIIRKILRYIL
ncbi:DUF4817 domain-containing protein [Trichonephila clavipes]|nr:DUF4817 domain-containing protein [Trichonephila clavipes]